jgi:type I restriction enzyme M protein
LAKLKRDRTKANAAVKKLEDDFWPLDSGGRAAKAKQLKAKAAATSGAVAEGQQALLLEVEAAVPAAAPAEKPSAGLHQARDALKEACGERGVVLGILRDDLGAKLEGHVVRGRRELVSAYRNWEDKYAVSSRDVEAWRARAAAKLEGFLKELGYGE